jgi:3-oxoacyl-[acyl-carrier protein] reductase
VGEELLGPTLIALGTPEQQERFLPPIRLVTELWCQGYSEPGAGSDLANVAHGDRVAALPCDVTDEAQVHELIEGAAGHFGRIDVLINNAGPGGTASVLDLTDEQWLRVLDVTLTGTFRCTRAALRRMVAQGRGGAVVNNASVLGWRAQPGQAHYAAAKAGVMAFTRCAALDVAAHGIRVNAVAPSLAIHPFLAKVTSEDLLAELAGREAFGRAAEPWEVANVMVFLASDYAGYMTGEVVSVSGQHP